MHPLRFLLSPGPIPDHGVFRPKSDRPKPSSYAEPAPGPASAAVAVKLCKGICQDPEEPERTFWRIDPELAGDLGRRYNEPERCEIVCCFPFQPFRRDADALDAPDPDVRHESHDVDDEVQIMSGSSRKYLTSPRFCAICFASFRAMSGLRPRAM